MRNFLLMFIIQFSVITVAFSAPTVTDVVVKAGYPCVDITCNVSGIDGEYKFDVSATLPDIGISKCIVAETGESIGDFIVRANGQYHLIWDARAELGEVRYANLVVRVTLQEVDKVQLWDGGPCWAIKNIGAEKPWERGYYFWWGDTIGYKFENDKWVASDGSNSNFSFTIRNTPTDGKSLLTLKSEGWITSDDVLALDYDAGHMQLGDDWRMPTKQELEALLTECDWTWVSTNDICGYIVRGKDKYISRSIFLPATGYVGSGTHLWDVNLRGHYWSLNPDDNNRNSYYLYFYASSVIRNVQSNSERYEGKPIRPVSGSVKIILAGQSAVFSLDTRDVLRVTNVVAKQRYPWNGLVDLTCNVTGIEGECKFVVSAILPDTGNVNRLSTCVIAETGVNTSDFLIKTNGLYHLLWDAKAELGEVWYTNMVLRVGLERFKIQLWEGGPYWATTNIGADKPWETGLYFWWGDSIGYKFENDKWVASDGSNSNFSFSLGNTPTYGKSTSTLKSEGWITADGVLTPEHDAAHVHWGNDWRMPTTNDWHMLINNCDLEFSKTNGVNGYIVRGRGACADNSIFLPITGIGYNASRDEGSAGYYWASVPYLDVEDFGIYGWSFYITERYKSLRNQSRYSGITIRPVQGVAK